MDELQKPKPVLKRNVTIRADKLLGTVKEALQLNWINAGTELAQSFGLEENSLEEKAWDLIIKAIMLALKNLVEDNRLILETDPKNIEVLQNNVELYLEVSHDSITPKLFRNPKGLEVLDNLRPSIIQWAKVYSLKDQEAAIFADSFKSYFAVALYEVWAKDAAKYQVLKDAYDNNPFTDDVDKELTWKRYHAKLDQDLDQPVFGDTFSLRSIYVPLRIAVPTEENKNHHDVIDAETYLKEWLETADASIRVISGGPGSGKSTFAKHFAIEASKLAYKVLFIQLHLMDYRLELKSALADYLASSPTFPLTDYNPLEDHNVQKLLIIFDGLDELSLTSGSAELSVTNFVNEVARQVGLLKGRNIKFLLLGRTRVVQEQQVSALNMAGSVFELLPYYLTHFDRRRFMFKLVEYEDQRNLWWKKFSKIKLLSYQSLPEKLRVKGLNELSEITAQPLLNYLVAHRFIKNSERFDPKQNLNQLYYDLISEIYNRPWGDGQNLHFRGVTKDQYFTMLEHVAVCAWHGGDTRTARTKDIVKALPRNLENNFEALGESVEKGASRLLTGFYSRKAKETLEGDETFEFTHKSFGEYLTSRRIVQIFINIDQGYRNNDREDDLLKRWVEVCGQVNIDRYLKSFLEREVQIYSEDIVLQWQETAVNLLKYVIVNHMPVDQMKAIPFTTMLDYDRNAQEALLVFHSCCAQKTNKISNFIVENNLLQAFNYLASSTSWVYLSSLNHLGLQGAYLYSMLLSEANLGNANLSEANLSCATLIGTNLNRANLSNAHLDRAQLRGATLIGTNLNGANLNGADLSGASIRYADLSNTDLSGATLIEADLRHADLRGAELIGASLIEADLRDADLRGADLSNTDLIAANFKDALMDDYTKFPTGFYVGMLKVDRE